MTARWLHRLLTSNCPKPEVWRLLLVGRYDVDTVVPSLRPAAAWLSIWQPDLRDEIIRREPLVLLRYGDPASLPLEARKHLLTAYAAKDNTADISEDHVDDRELRAFAHQELAGTIRQVWASNQRPDFHFGLLLLIREGRIKGCRDVVRSVALDAKADDHHRIVALQALRACNDQTGLRRIAAALMKAPEKASARLAAGFALILFPRHIDTDDLLRLISNRSQGGVPSTAAGSKPT